jgi:transcription elongation factor Elf1
VVAISSLSGYDYGMNNEKTKAKGGTIEPKDDFFDQDDHFPKDCPMCNHENGAIGVLGKTLQFCCRMCGVWYT